jgi:hypothetical protein
LDTASEDLLQKIGWVNTAGMDNGTKGSEACGIKNVAPSLSKLAVVWPWVVMAHLSLLLLHLESKQYMQWGAVRYILIRGNRVLVRLAKEADMVGRKEKEADPR